ncbi:bacterial proteasome activator family protein [Arthrobacter wenxiniae]|uniref:Bacterial proteasome activator n=1 Tax=Arthrobacter wenxiniae TaxID=2713570 RepID=A0A7Y7IHX7_9MICC|nr:bacterial proteasome activator family protein [Arthrobacter wenxiniae]NVM95608.1 bacterial proteasome activator family protein [Arthrobacter wenxiniae]
MTDKANPQAAGAAAEGKVMDDPANVKADGRGEATDGPRIDGQGGGPQARHAGVAEMVDQPAKVMRIGTMVKQLLDEVKSAPLDEAARARLAEIHGRSIAELEDGLSPDLVEELHRLNLPFTDAGAPSDAELRIAQAQLVGWLEGLFHGIQTAMAAQAMANQQVAARLQLHQLPPGTVIAPGVVVGENGEPQRAPVSRVQGHPEGSGQSDAGGPGQYL